MRVKPNQTLNDEIPPSAPTIFKHHALRITPQIGEDRLTSANLGYLETPYANANAATATSGHFTLTVNFLPKRFM